MKDYLIDHKEEVKRLNFQNKIDAYSLEKELESFVWNKEKNILDAGCGNGNVIERLLNMGIKKLHGIDLSSDRVNQARERFKQYDSVTFSHGALENTGLKENSFDVIFCRYIFEHLTNPSEVLSELYRILKPGGEVRIVNFDDIFCNFHTKNERLNKLLKQLEQAIPQDLKIGRKLPQLLHLHRFENVSWDAQTYFFKGDRMRLEIENSRMRLEQGRDHLSKFFDSLSEYDDFSRMYLKEMEDDRNVMFANKFIISAHKINPS